MNIGSNKTKTSYSLKISKRHSKIDQFCNVCSAISREVKQIRELHKHIVRDIYQLTTFVTTQIAAILTKMKNSTNYQLEGSYTKHRTTKSTIQKPTVRMNSPEPPTQYESKLKAEDSAIKQSIFKELKMIRALQNKEKDLRIANQKHSTLRKSLSKDSIASVKVTKPKPPSSARSIQYATLSPNHQRNFRVEITTEDQFISSPKFGQIQQNPKIQPHRHSSQDAKSKKSKSIREQNSQYIILKCPNGHQCYRGDTLNSVPHGSGLLINCCSKMPFKVNSKTVKYTGNFSFGNFEGKGILICKDNVKFQGNFSKGLRQGQGVIYLQGSSERGIWDQDKLISFI